MPFLEALFESKKASLLDHDLLDQLILIFKTQSVSVLSKELLDNV